MSPPLRALLAVAASLAAAGADDGLSLSLDEAVALALTNSPQLQAARLSVRIEAHAVAAEAARFGRTASAGASHRADRSPSISALERVETVTSSVAGVDVGLAQALASGGRVGLSFGNERYASNAAYRILDPVYQSQLAVEFAQPLLRGRGEVNRAPLQLARGQLAIAEVELDGGEGDLRAGVSAAYWDLYAARQGLTVQEQLVGGAGRVLETVRARAAAGADPQASVLQARVGVARREESAIRAEGEVQRAEDRLKALSGIDRDPARWPVRLLPTSAPEAVAFDADLAAGIDAAIARSPACRAGGLRVQSLDLQLSLARDRTRPEVNLTARAAVSGIGGGYGDDLEVLRQADGRSWGGGVRLEVPLGADPPQRQEYRRRQLEQERGQIELEQTRLEVVRQVRAQHRLVGLSRRRWEVADLALQLAEQSVAEQEQRLALGLATVRDVLDAQDDLAETRLDRLAAVVDYAKALVEWRRLTGAP